MIEIKKLGIQSENITAVLGPAICKKCYEFGNEAKELFDEQYLSKKGDRYHVDLKSWTADELKKGGVGQVEDVGICTYEDQRFFSYRRDKDKNDHTGRFMTVVALPNLS